jgi:hypothetical protein
MTQSRPSLSVGFVRSSRQQQTLRQSPGRAFADSRTAPKRRDAPRCRKSVFAMSFDIDRRSASVRPILRSDLSLATACVISFDVGIGIDFPNARPAVHARRRRRMRWQGSREPSASSAPPAVLQADRITQSASSLRPRPTISEADKYPVIVLGRFFRRGENQPRLGRIARHRPVGGEFNDLVVL